MPSSTAVSRVIEVAKVQPPKAALPEVPYKDAVEALLTRPPARSPWEVERPTPPTRPVEACTRYHGRLVAGVHFHPVVAAVHHAFNDHRPLALSPDASEYRTSEVTRHLTTNINVIRHFLDRDISCDESTGIVRIAAAAL